MAVYGIHTHTHTHTHTQRHTNNRGLKLRLPPSDKTVDSVAQIMSQTRLTRIS